MLDVIKLVISEAQHQIHILESKGETVDKMWLDRLKNQEFFDQLTEVVVNKSFSSIKLMACFVGEQEAKSYVEAVYLHVLWRHFPKVGIYESMPGIASVSAVFLPAFRAFHKLSLKLDHHEFLSRYPFQLLTEEEIQLLENPQEYRYVQEAFHDDYIYEMMVLNKDTKGFSTVDHISGVHYLAMFIARQIADKGIDIDLGWVSGAAALHDIGKFGCLPEEVKKVAYYHYYYSDLWFRDRAITYIRQIAVNHSTWDLELANLPIESLVLIYADFRVKHHDDPQWPYPMKFFDLDESFHVILDKLDNVDADKEKRYKKVYDKLKDFERFLVSQQIKTSWDEEAAVESGPWLTTDTSLLSECNIQERLRIKAVAYNVRAMHTFRNESSLKDFLYQAKNLDDSHALRRHVHLLSQFSRYLTDGQKFTILDFLYELFLRPEEDLRKQAAETFGEIISHFDAPYGKYLPPSAPADIFKNSKSDALRRYSDQFLTFEDRTELKVSRIGSALVSVFKMVLNRTKQVESTLQLLISLVCYKNLSENRFFIKVLSSVVPTQFSSEDISKIIPQLIELLKRGESVSEEIRVDALIALKRLAKAHSITIEEHLANAGLESLNAFNGLIKRTIDNREMLLEVYLENSHISTPDEVKRRNIAGILHYVLRSQPQEAFAAVIHFCNLLKGSLAQDVRLSAAKSVVVLNGRLSDSEHIELTLELLKGLEIDHYSYTKYMPQTLGRILVGLSDSHLDNVLQDLKHKVKTGTSALKVLIIETIAHAINSGLVVNVKHENRVMPIESMLGIITSGLVQDDEAVHLAAFQALCGTILNSHLTSLVQRGELFKLYTKKMATLLKSVQISKAMEVAYAYNFSVLYRFITEHLHEVGPLPIQEKSRAAYFQGAFDPVSLGQKSVVLSLEAQSVSVYVALDAYCWQRQTQPVLHRRKMLEITFADCLNTHLLPSDFSINFNHPKSLLELKGRLPEGDPYLVMGEDALISHALYKGSLDIIKDWPHFLVSRHSLTSKRHQQVASIKKQLNTTIQIEPIGYHSSITPDHVRRAIDKHLDLEDVLDPLAIDYIKEKHLYRNEPQFKASLGHKQIDVLNAQSLTPELESLLLSDLDLDLTRYKAISDEAKDSFRIVLIRENGNGKLIAVGAYRKMLKSEYESANKTMVMRRDYVDLYPENTAVIEFLHLSHSNWRDDYTFSLQTELLVDAINNGYEFAVYYATGGTMSTDVLEALRATGFIEIKDLRWLMVSLKSPVALILDAQTVLKEDYRQDKTLRTTLKKMRISLMQGIIKSYPKQVILAFDRGMLYDRLVQLITSINLPENGSAFGPILAVPYGDLFKRWTLPQTITKALHTERVYDSTLSYFDVQASPYHLPLKEQIALLKAFNMPVILIDDLLDKGLRLQAIDGDFKKYDVNINHIVVGIMSGLGQQRMAQKGYSVKAGYFLPQLCAWFTESLLYPFIGGDSMSAYGEQVVNFGVLQAVNRIAPYFTSPEAQGMSVTQYVQLSEVCMENAHMFITAIEQVYEERTHRPLTINRLSEVFIAPRMPYYGDGVQLSGQGIASEQLVYDKLRLKQLAKLVRRT